MDLSKLTRYDVTSENDWRPLEGPDGAYVRYEDLVALLAGGADQPDESLTAGDFYAAARACWCQATMHDQRQKGLGAEWEALGQHLLAVAERFGGIGVEHMKAPASLLLRTSDGALIEAGGAAPREDTRETPPPQEPT